MGVETLWRCQSPSPALQVCLSGRGGLKLWGKQSSALSWDKWTPPLPSSLSLSPSSPSPSCPRPRPPSPPSSSKRPNSFLAMISCSRIGKGLKALRHGGGIGRKEGHGGMPARANFADKSKHVPSPPLRSTDPESILGDGGSRPIEEEEGGGPLQQIGSNIELNISGDDLRHPNRLYSDSVVLKELTEHFRRMELAQSYATAAVSSSSYYRSPMRVNFAAADMNKETQMPVSLRILKRKHSSSSKEERVVCMGESFKKAFSSLIFMMRTIQSHTLSLREVLLYEETDGSMYAAEKEMHTSFVWLFQKVFACTPKLMVLVMLLLADFTVHSMGSNVGGLAANMLPTFNGPAFVITLRNTNVGALDLISESTDTTTSSIDHVEVSSSMNIQIDRGIDQDTFPPSSSTITPFYPENEPIFRPDIDDAGAENCQTEGGQQLLRNQNQNQNLCEAFFDSQRMHSLAAPVQVELEPDDYLCYDRTELIYRHAISTDSTNPLLLTNYAQFLHLVRHDIKRAEEFFLRALKADPSDAEVCARFGTFLWVACGDNVAAEQAYKAAMASDPTNPYHAGSYAHFLWHSGEEDTSSDGTKPMI